MDLHSSCCSCPAGEYEDYGICPDCKEPCDWVDYDEEESEEDV